MSKAVPEVVTELHDSATLIATWRGTPVENGLTVNLDDTFDEPEIDIKGGRDLDTYTLMLVDADAPSPSSPKYRCWLHWLVVNIPAHDVSAAPGTAAEPVIPRGEVVQEYSPPEPARGRHRLLFLLYKQNGRVAVKKPAKRQGFQVRAWAQDHNLGNPATGLWVYAQADEE
ncbi:hypothetical protein N2152v2_003150 [Parachlorella kessleri]